jgi:hypothetical protein
MYKIEVSVLGVSRTIYSRFRLSKWHVGLVFLGSWYLAVALLALYGDPSLRSGSGVFLRLSGLGVLFAIVPTGLMFAIAGASVSHAANASGQSEEGDLSVAGGTIRVSLNRLLLIMALIVTLGAAWDWSRASKARDEATKVVVFQGYAIATYRS